MSNKDELNKIRKNVENNMYLGTPKEYRAFNFLLSEIAIQNETIEELEWANNEWKTADELWKKTVERLGNTLKYLKQQMQIGKKYGYESDTIFWDRCIWEIDEAIGEETTNET